MKTGTTEKHKGNLTGDYATLIIIGINIVIYIVLNALPDLTNELLIHPEIILQKPWTMVTVFFSHTLHIHLLINMVLFYVFGSKLERLTSPKTVLMTYLICGFIGSLVIIPVASILQGTQQAKEMAGASAAVFGVVAAYTAMQPNALMFGSKAKIWLVALFGFNAALAIMNPQTTVSAVVHVTGMGAGLIFGYLLRKKLKT